MEQPLLTVAHDALPGECEDCYAVRELGGQSVLCVADGCGGLGARRYPQLAGRSGAYLASRLATRAFLRWWEERQPMPDAPTEGEALLHELESDLHGAISGFAQRHCQAASRISGSLIRTLPTTLCAAVTRQGEAARRELCFLWAGDSRGYVLDAEGLHQCTADHLRGAPDAFESLYLDPPLARLLCAEAKPRLSMRRLCVSLPCVVTVATDGVYSCLPTPMELEMLLLNALQAAKSYERWQAKLLSLIRKVAHDDATLLLQPCGFTDFEDMKRRLLPRRERLQKGFITPVRRRKGDLPYARERWLAYRATYDWTASGGCYEQQDWRL